MPEPKTYDLAGVTEMRGELKGKPCETCVHYRLNEQPELQGMCVKYDARQWPRWRLFDCWSHTPLESLSGLLVVLEAAVAKLTYQINRRAK